MAPINNAADLFTVNGLVAVVTGGGSGLGLYAARALDANGAKAVYIVGRREKTLQEAATTAKNGSLIPIVGDVTDKDSLLKVMEEVKREQGFINLLYCNAGVTGPILRDSLPKKEGKPTVQELQAALWKPEQAEFAKAFEVNCTAMFYTAVAFLDLLDAGNKKRNVAQDSQILVTSSIAGFSRMVASGPAYSASKAAATHLVKVLSTNLSQNGFGIRVNAIAPGLYPSEMTTTQTSQLDTFGGVEGHQNEFEGAHAMPTETCPAGRTGSEQDFAGTVLFMASRAGAYLNGETLVTDGGRLSQMPSVY